MDSRGLVAKPAHIPDELVVDFDFYLIPGGDRDPHQALHQFQTTHPDIFWTPRNGGHWVFTRVDDIEEILKSPAQFSSRRVILPRDDNAPRMLPVESDPPDHTELRQPLNKALANPAHLEGGVRDITISLIEPIAPRGGCEFVEDFARLMPMYVFLDMVELPRADRVVLCSLVDRFLKGGTLHAREEAQNALFDYLLKHVRERRENPGADLLSQVVNCKVQGRVITEAEALSYMLNLLLGGLDTVAATLSFIVRFLAGHPGHLTQLRDRLDDTGFIGRATDELFRAHGVAMASRVVTSDVTFKGVQLRENDTLLSVYNLGGLDDRRFPKPLEIDFDRPNARQHTTFGKGAHFCAGARLARIETIVFLQEWLKRIPKFAIREGAELRCVTGATSMLESLPLVWDV